MQNLSIHLAPDVLYTLGGIPITSTLLTSIVVSVLLVVVGFSLTRRLVLVPNKTQVVLEAAISLPYEFVRDTLKNDRVTERVFPYIMTLFLFILAANWFGLLPFIGALGFWNDGYLTSLFYPVNTDLNITFALAVVSFILVEFVGITALGFFRYAGKFINVKSPAAFFVGLIELTTEIARLLSFSFRLFGNIFAGKVLILVATAFVPFILPVPLLAFEVMVGFIQAAIFAILTLFFVKIAIEEPH
jgi:F-type H+-transporting ATPase subunit a